MQTRWAGILVLFSLLLTASAATADSALVSGHSLGAFLVEHLESITNHAVRFDPHMEPLTTLSQRRADDGAGPTLLEAISANTYDAAIVMERYYPLNQCCDTVRTGGTERSLFQAQERLLQRNPNAKLVFYSPWEGVDDGDDISAWIQYERDITPLFQCIVSEVNATFAGRGSSARITYVPAHLAMAELTSAVRLGSVPEVVGDWKRLYNEGGHDIHLNWQNGIAEYYVSLVTYGYLYGPPNEGTGVTPKVKLGAKGIARLKQMAASFVRDNPLPALSVSDCQSRAARLCSVGAQFGGMYDSEAVCAEDLRRVFNGGP
ncbi:MAG: hypothetical protein ABW252_09990 [Polyangiales bacterium]